MFSLTSLLLLAQEGGFDVTTLLPFLAIGVLFYFLMIRPQPRRQAKQRDTRCAMKR
ncbi:MAG: preprotein translocase subunit YajC, partial [Planctomycetes bacterium]|nr:preprotein translocase subunit YajC [Planctomycetota bacterium]